MLLKQSYLLHFDLFCYYGKQFISMNHHKAVSCAPLLPNVSFIQTAFTRLNIFQPYSIAVAIVSELRILNWFKWISDMIWRSAMKFEGHFRSLTDCILHTNFFSGAIWTYYVKFSSKRSWPLGQHSFKDAYLTVLSPNSLLQLTKICSSNTSLAFALTDQSDASFLLSWMDQLTSQFCRGLIFEDPIDPSGAKFAGQFVFIYVC